MPSSEKVQNTHIAARMRELHAALLEIAAVLNRPQGDQTMIREAGIALDRALFPLLVLVERLQPIGVVELAERVGRNYTTVSRQLAKLESLGLVARADSLADARVREAVVTAKGKAMAARVDAARERLGAEIFADWDEREFEELVRLMKKFAEAFAHTGDRA